MKGVIGFEQIVSVNNLTVKFNNSLIDLNGFSSLKEISGNVTISNNDELMYFSPFIDIAYFNGDLKVINNKSLYEADGLYELYSMASSSELKNNTE